MPPQVEVARQLEPHGNAREAGQIGGGADPLDGDVHSLQWHSVFLGIHFDKRDAAGGDSGQEGLAVGEGVRLGVRRRVEDETLAARLADGAPDRAAAGRPDRVDLVGPSPSRSSVILLVSGGWDF